MCLGCASAVDVSLTSRPMECFLCTHHTIAAIAVSPAIAAVAPRPMASFSPGEGVCFSKGNEVGVSVVTSAKTV